MDVVTINTDSAEKYEEKLRTYFLDGYKIMSCSCGYYGISSDNCFPYWMAVLVKEN